MATVREIGAMLLPYLTLESTHKRRCPQYRSKMYMPSQSVLPSSRPNKLSKTRKIRLKEINKLLSSRDSTRSKSKKRPWPNLSSLSKRSLLALKKPKRRRIPSTSMPQSSITRLLLLSNQPLELFWFSMRSQSKKYWLQLVRERKKNSKASTQILAKMIRNKLERILRKNIRDKTWLKNSQSLKLPSMTRKLLQSLQVPTVRMKSKPRLQKLTSKPSKGALLTVKLTKKIWILKTNRQVMPKDLIYPCLKPTLTCIWNPWRLIKWKFTTTWVKTLNSSALSLMLLFMTKHWNKDNHSLIKVFHLVISQCCMLRL